MRWIKASEKLPEKFDNPITARDIKTKIPIIDLRYLLSIKREDLIRCLEWLDETEQPQPDETLEQRISSSTNSEIGSSHWFNTLNSKTHRIGEFLKEITPTEELLKEWGKVLCNTAKELYSGYNSIAGAAYMKEKMQAEIDAAYTAGMNTVS